VPNDLQVICQILIKKLDNARSDWSTAVKTALATVPRGPQPDPQLFSFSGEDGLNIEADIIFWQMMFAIQFAVQHEYVNTQEEDAFRNEWVFLAQNDIRWLTSFACAFSETAPDEDSIVSALGSYLLQDVTNSTKIETTCNILKKCMLLLRLQTFIATANAFGDLNTAHELEESGE
jgi:hypothetical protein